MNGLREALDNCAATLETLLTWYGDTMPEADQRGRAAVLAEARAALKLADESQNFRVGPLLPDGALEDLLKQGEDAIPQPTHVRIVHITNSLGFKHAVAIVAGVLP